jgi:ferredoxin-NADP reductase
MNVKTHTVKLKERQWVAIQTAAFRLERPQGYEYKAGQFTEVKLDGKSHIFTLASAPRESDLMFVTRMRKSEFKNSLDELTAGDSVRIAPADGDFVLEKGDEPVVFVAGGIGVTPVRSMVLDAAQTDAMQRMYFFYANHRPEDAAFLIELGHLAEEKENFHLVPTMTRPDTSRMPWDGETGHIDAEMIRKHVPEMDSARYYVCGPPEMVDASESMLENAGVSEERIHAEHFSGY